MGTRERGGRTEAGALWWWAAPSVALLVGMALWGIVRYPDLPERIPQHIGGSGVDAWGERSVGLAFLPVFVYAGLTALLVGCVWGLLRATPLDAMPPPKDRWAQAEAAGNNRPASAASARAMARALLLTNALVGVALLPMAWVQWRATQTTHVSGWLTAAMVLALVASVVPPCLAGWRDSREKRALRELQRTA
ncbi:DUF1648 domain-containing protein [Streptomyces sp. 3MP-14]|uniref:DUF1648 domain-containing protein n=1 Tax=Streptomyces mimosae TaxID=2586635 RepID=A0A5N6AE59_9ACTN|nr:MULTISPECIES: DUF1648 domain-containing protein [Streptomyces]KAB8165798.1 DUF1648 domain-containing protein [Streptomyces mimosae]KAB8176187.1 DUF1648 domain-containing protein [Streptomyces sp. 3MP-14]